MSSTSFFSSSNVPDGAVHKALGLRVRAYIRKVEGGSAAEREALLMSAYQACEAKLQIPAGRQGKGWVKEHYPRLEAAKSLIRDMTEAAPAEQNGTHSAPQQH